MLCGDDNFGDLLSPSARADRAEVCFVDIRGDADDDLASPGTRGDVDVLSSTDVCGFGVDADAVSGVVDAFSSLLSEFSVVMSVRLSWLP